MITSWVSNKGSFLLQAAMNCFFTCFRIKDTSAPSSSSSHLSSTSSDVAATKRSSLSSLMLSEEDERGKLRIEEKENTKEEEAAPEAELNWKELKDEAMFLKACGTLPETPAEVRKFSKEGKYQSSDKAETEQSTFKSWLIDTSFEKPNLENDTDQLPTPVKKCEESVEGTVSLEHTPNSCMTEGQNSRRISTSSVEGSGIQKVTMPNEVHTIQNYISAPSSVPSRNLARTSQGRNKSVRFDCESSLSSISSGSSSSENQNSEYLEVAGNYSFSKSSPYPTPLKLSDEMQTPGTVFPAYLESTANGKKTRIRSQYVCSVLNPVEDFSQWKILKDEDYGSNQPAGQPGQSLAQVDVRSSLEKNKRHPSVEDEWKVEASLSSWLKPAVTTREAKNNSTSSENARCGSTPGDRPILGMVAAHWNDDEQSRITPKWWDGNGIPNSTNKYKEDQKVSWHATPFEERLEKALSAETVISQRKQVNGTPPIDFGEGEESDTALSKFQSSNSTSLISTVSC